MPASQMITAAVDISGILVICGFSFVIFHFTERKRQEGQHEGKPRGLDDPIIKVGSMVCHQYLQLQSGLRSRGISWIDKGREGED